MRKRMSWGVVLVYGISAAWPAAAAAAGSPSDHLEGTADHVHVTLVSPLDPDKTKFAITLTVDAGFHINANPASQDYLIPTTLHVTNRTPLRVTYPPPLRFKPKFFDQPIDVYEGIVRIVAEFSRDARPPPALIGTVTAQACTEVICLPPADLPLPDQSVAPPQR